MTAIYDAINDSLLAEKGMAIVRNSEENAYNALRTVQEQHLFSTSELFYDYLRDDEDRWMQDNFNDTPEAKHSGSGKRHGWKYRTYMPKKYWNSRTTIGRAIDAGIDVTGLGKSELQKKTAGKADDLVDSSTSTKSSNLAKYMDSWEKCRTYYNSASGTEQVDMVQFSVAHPIF